MIFRQLKSQKVLIFLNIVIIVHFTVIDPPIPLLEVSEL